MSRPNIKTDVYYEKVNHIKLAKYQATKLLLFVEGGGGEGGGGGLPSLGDDQAYLAGNTNTDDDVNLVGNTDDADDVYLYGDF